MTEPNLDEQLSDLLDWYSRYRERGQDDDMDRTYNNIKAIIATQIQEAIDNIVDTICDVEATREVEGKDYISWEAFERIKAIAQLRSTPNDLL